MNEVRGNVIVGQSGGPTAVINSSLAGVYKTARDRGAKKVYGMLHGIQGLLQERYVDLSEHIKNDLDIELLKRTPSAYLGSCRFKLPEISEDRAIYDRIFEILDGLEVEYFFYIGGNDSMDTIKKLSDYALLNGSKIRFMGVPKTIDNDLAATDHTPGYGSAAKYIGSITKEVIRDGLVYDQQNVTILEIMGRNAGWLTGAAALATVSYTHLDVYKRQVRDFLNIHDRLDDRYRIYARLLEDGSFMVKLMCMDPSECLRRCLDQSESTVFFSATLLPVQYYKELLSGDPQEYAVYAKSPFSPENRLVLAASDVSSRYKMCIRDRI